MQPLRWQNSAACCGGNPDWWFPPHTVGSDKVDRRARLVCWDCPVRLACLEYALSNDEEYGTWGGYTHTERVMVSRLPGPLRSRVHLLDGEIVSGRVLTAGHAL